MCSEIGGAKGTRTAAEGEATCGYFNWIIFVPAGK